MSDNWLQLVPIDPTYRPSRQAAERARLLLKSFLPKSDEVTIRYMDSIEFIHPGSNWSGVKCPACGADAETWFGDAMDAASVFDFSNLSVVAPCCSESVSLNELDYVYPAAFSSFVLEAMNPEREVNSEQVQQLMVCLGSELKRIWRHI
jgi:hypothetical protein